MRQRGLGLAHLSCKAQSRHRPFEAPAKFHGSEEEVMPCFRRIRDQLKLAFEAYSIGCLEARRPECQSS